MWPSSDDLARQWISKTANDLAEITMATPCYGKKHRVCVYVMRRLA